MSRPFILDRKTIIILVKKYKGKIALVARDMNCAVSTIYNYAKKYKSVANAIKSAQDNWDCTLVDAAETKLFKAVTDNAAWAIKYTLETKGRRRGYSTAPLKPEEDQQKTAPVKVNIIVKDSTETPQ
jgi:hypothetical protein